MSDLDPNQTTEAIPAVVAPGRKLGKLPPKHDPRTLRLASYIEKRALPKIPQDHTLSTKTVRAFGMTVGMLGNDVYGDCTFASLAHAYQVWTTYGGGVPWCPSSREVVDAYLKHTGGVDNGAFMLDVLKLMRGTGWSNGEKIEAFVALDPLDHDQVRTAHYLFGPIYFGCNLPANAQSQKVWDLKPGAGSEPGSWGGHCGCLWDIKKKSVVIATWGGLQEATWEWWDRYTDEGYAILEKRWVGEDRRSPQGFSFKKLDRDLKAF